MNGEPIIALRTFLLDSNLKVIDEKFSDRNGEVEFKFLDNNLPLLGVEKFSDKTIKPLCYINHHHCREFIFVSPKIKTELETYEKGEAGDYLRHGYLTKNGDSLNSIMSLYGIDIEELVEINPSVKNINVESQLKKDRYIKLPSYIKREDW